MQTMLNFARRQLRKWKFNWKDKNWSDQFSLCSYSICWSSIRRKRLVSRFESVDFFLSTFQDMIYGKPLDFNPIFVCKIPLKMNVPMYLIFTFCWKFNFGAFYITEVKEKYLRCDLGQLLSISYGIKNMSCEANRQKMLKTNKYHLV